MEGGKGGGAGGTNAEEGDSASDRSDEGTSSGSEDNAWFNKPSSNAGAAGAAAVGEVKVKRAPGMASPGKSTGSNVFSYLPIILDRVV